ncbi:MAG: aldehyde ferredoxin oxidoreductase C-terminal domain-containing protein, partial [Desulfurivibrionaceae bacterium]|nr:aldehyde ferredoxin oxidoreductase C-terminal domain-containing protein [Desulfurivibrionaceae bacterium]
MAEILNGAGVGFFEETEEITANAVIEGLKGEMEGCTACNIKCKKTVSLEGKYAVDPRNGGPEYETLGSLGSLCGVGNL